jgi:hypothetical protein
MPTAINRAVGSHCNGQLPFLGYISPSKTAFAMATTVIATARCKITTAVATVILSDIICFLNNNNSTVNQWLITCPGYILLSKTAFAMAATAPLEAIAILIPSDIMRFLSNHYSTENQW